jgi:circadian clock protein KaiC
VLTHLHTLLDHLSGRGCLVIVTLAQKGLLDEPPEPDLETSYIADSVILLRQYASHRQIRRSIAVVKKRHSVHERGIRELVIRPGAVEVREMSEEAADAAIGATPISGS